MMENKEMKTCRPDYYDRFRCIAGSCKDSCCIGWEIHVDEDKIDYYRHISGELGTRLKMCIDWEEKCFLLQGAEERCPFLNQDNLCDLILGLGEDSLCDICREHPRFYDWFDGYTEMGLGICCEEAARILLESEKKQELLSDIYVDEEPWINVLFSARKTAFLILQDRNQSIWTRLYIFAKFIAELQDCIDFNNIDEAEETSLFYQKQLSTERDTCEKSGLIEDRFLLYEELLNICSDLEPIDTKWPELIAELRKFLENREIVADTECKLDELYGEMDFQYEHLAVYFTYRYFMKSRNDSNIYSKGFLVIFCVLLIRLLDLWELYRTKKITTESRSQGAKNVSKEIEYSEENLNALEELFFEMDIELFYKRYFL